MKIKKRASLLGTTILSVIGIFAITCEYALALQGVSGTDIILYTVGLQVSEHKLAEELGFYARRDVFPYKGKNLLVASSPNTTSIVDGVDKTVILFKFSGDDEKDYRVSQIYSPLSKSDLLRRLSKIDLNEIRLLERLIAILADANAQKVDWIEIPQEVPFEIVDRALNQER